jgi:glycerol-3-phosphate acyltransferase PlsY
MEVKYLMPVLGFLLGSIPFGYILVRITTGADIRRTGSGNIGATNVFRQSRTVGVLTFLLDAGKGYAAVWAAGLLGADIAWQSVAAVAAILGHVFTVFLRFRGGKGVAVGFGAFLALTPAALLPTMIVFLLTAILTRYVSLASILATGTYPLWVFLHREPPVVFWMAALGAAIIVAKHHQNIRRLLSGTEGKFALGSRGR